MRRTVYLSSLTVGRCFTLPVDPIPTEETPATLTKSESILPPDAAWKVTAADDAELTAHSASGEDKTFAADTKVVEIPRQGYERLVSRSA